MPMDPAKYPPNWKTEIRPRILARASNKCEHCKAPNGVMIARGMDNHAGSYMLENGDVFDDKTGMHLGAARGSEYTYRFVMIVLTIAHLDHDTTHNDDDNLAALCQKCHLAHDHALHIEHARETRRARKAIGDLFAT